MKYKLLAADGDSTGRHSLCRTLNAHLGDQLTIFEAASGQEALALFHREAPDIVVLNVELSEISGLDVARTIRKTSKVCAILLTADLDRFTYAKQAIALRALDYIPKPYDDEKLVLAVQEAIQNLIFLGNAVRKAPPLHRLDSTPEDTPENIRLALVRSDIQAYIESHYMEELSMKNVAHAMNYSDAYFCKLFKQCFHVNFSAYLNEYRIDRAKTMIGNPRVNVKDVGLACGFTDSNYFSRVFKRITGLTPTEYRISTMETPKTQKIQ